MRHCGKPGKHAGGEADAGAPGCRRLRDRAGQHRDGREGNRREGGSRGGSRGQARVRDRTGWGSEGSRRILADRKEWDKSRTGQVMTRSETGQQGT